SFTLHIIDRAGNTRDVTLSIQRDAGSGSVDMVTQWDQNTLAAIAADGSQPTVASRTLAMEAAAVFDVVNAIDGVNGLYVTVDAVAGTSLDAAVAAAAADVLSTIYPSQSASIASALAASLATIPAGAARDDGVALGQTIGDAIVALRANDHSHDFVSY